MDFIANNLELLGFAFFAITIFIIISGKNRKLKKAKTIHKKSVKAQELPFSLHPRVNPQLCGGCGACTKVCPEGDILKLVDHKAVLVKPTKCVGHGECERACPFDAIDLVFGTKQRGVDIPRITSNFETNVQGLYIAGELGGMGLIRNAVKQGTAAATHACKKLKTNPNVDTDILVIGAGPAGLSAALTAIINKKKYICLEQNTFGGTVYNFPKQKVVMTYPAEVPGFGKMKFPRNKVTKEELLGYWNMIRKKSQLKIKENTRFINLKKENDIFYVETSAGEIKAQKVILCMGVRGTPRKLGLANEDLPKVAYNLVDPAQYRKKHVAIVGGGNAAVEAAQMLGEAKYKNKVTLLVRGGVLDRCNDDNKDRINKMVDQGLVEIKYNTATKAIESDKLIITENGEDKEIPNDFLFIFAGAIMPYKFLMGLGIEIETSFGEKKMKSVV